MVCLLGNEGVSSYRIGLSSSLKCISAPINYTFTCRILPHFSDAIIESDDLAETHPTVKRRFYLRDRV